MNKWKEYENFLKKLLADCAKEEKLLAEEDRKDDANMCRIRSNIYGIFLSFLEVSADMGDEERESFIRSRAARVSQAWEESRKKAKEHKDAEKILIEEIKLEAAALALKELAGEGRKGDEA